jgi:GNAT superfamily N-acetyltransferase
MAGPRGNATIRRLLPDQASRSIEVLSDILVDCVEGGASVGFLAPLSPVRAGAFWHSVVETVADGSCALLVAEVQDGTIVGTVQVALGHTENQPHRADIRTLLIHDHFRRQGLGTALMRAAEETAREAGKTHLLLGTATGTQTGGDTERLYLRLGWTLIGSVPGFTLLPDGRPCDTSAFYKIIR